MIDRSSDDQAPWPITSTWSERFLGNPWTALCFALALGVLLGATIAVVMS